ncbi:MAG: MFS transporter [Ilumatobacteraceae bacterium]
MKQPTEAGDSTDGIVLTDAGHEWVADLEPGPITTSVAWASWALFAGLALMLVGAGIFATLLGVRSELDGFSALEIGLVSAAYYAGFLGGSRLSLRLLGTVGHIRVYAALASLLAASMLTSGLVSHPVAWILLRVATGVCLAGQYVVAESWLNQLVSNNGRGRLLSLYNVTTVVCYGIGQLWFTQLDPRAITGFAIAAILVSIAVAPVALSEDATPPVLTRSSRMTLRELWRMVPTGMVTSVLVGIAHGAFIGLGAVYGTRSGLSIGEIGVFVAMPTVGGLLLSVPVSSISDRIDRRLIGAGAAITALVGGLLLIQFGPASWVGLVAMAVVGGMTYPLYSIAGAYTNDWVPSEQLTAAAGQLVLLYGAGAFTGPIIGSFVMDIVGVAGFGWTTVVTHGAIALFLIVRMIQYPAAVRAKPWNEVPLSGRVLYLPATALAMGRRLRPGRRARRPEGD